MEKVQASLLRRGLCIVNIFSSFMLLYVKGYTGFNPTLQENSPQELPDTVAFVGAYFEYQFPSWYRSKSFSVQVTEAGNDALPTWLYFNRSASSLEGVPLATDEGFTYLQVSIRDLMEGTSASDEERYDVFAINVQFPGLVLLKTSFPKNSGSIFAKNSRTQQDEYGVHYCQTYEDRFFVSLMLKFSLEKSTAEQRIHIVKSFSDFLSKKPHEIVLSMRSNDVIRRLRGVVVLESKLEQFDNTSLPLLGDSQISWYIACNSFTRTEDLSRVLSHNIKSGLLQNVIGHAVVGWSLLAKKLQDKTVPMQKRIRRQVNGFQTPVPTPTLSTMAPSIFQSTPSSSVSQTVDVTPVMTVSSFVPLTTGFVSSPNPSSTVRPAVTTVREGSSIGFTMQTPSRTLVTETTKITSFTSSASTHLIPSSTFIMLTSSAHTVASSLFPSLQTDSSVTVSSQVMFTSTQSPVSSTVTTSSLTAVLQTSIISSKTTSTIIPPSAVTFLTSSRLLETTSTIAPTTTSLMSSRLLETTATAATSTIIPTSTATFLTSSRLLETTSTIAPTTTSLMSSRLLETSTTATSTITSLTPSTSLETTSTIIPPSTVTSLAPSRPLKTTSDIIPTSTVTSLTSSRLLETSGIATSAVTFSTPSILLETTSAITPTSTVASLTSSRLLETTISSIPTSIVTFLTPSISLETTSVITPTSTVASLTSSRLLGTTISSIPTSIVTFLTPSISLETTSVITPTSTVASLTSSRLLGTTISSIPTSAVTFSTPSISLETTSAITPTSTVASLTSSRLLETTISSIPTSIVTFLTPSISLETTSVITPTSTVASLTSSRLLGTTISSIPTSIVTFLTPSISLETTSAITPTSTFTFLTSRSLNTASSVAFTSSLSSFVGSSQHILPSTSFEGSSFTSSLPVHTSVVQSLATSIAHTSRSSINISPSVTSFPSDTFSLPVTFTDSVSTFTQSSQHIPPSTFMHSPSLTTSLPLPTSVRPSLTTGIIESSIISVRTSSVAPTTTDIHSSMTSSTVSLRPTAMKTPSLSTYVTIPSTFSTFPSKTSIVLQPSPTIQPSFMTIKTDTFTSSQMSPSVTIESTSVLSSLSVQSSFTPASVGETLSTFVPVTQSISVGSSSSHMISTTTQGPISTSFMSTSFSQMSSPSMKIPSSSQSSIMSKSPSFSSEVSRTLMTELFSSSDIQLSSSFTHSSVVTNYFSTPTPKPSISGTTRGSMSITSLQTSSLISNFTSLSETPLSRTSSIKVTPQTTSPFVLTPSTSLYSELTVSSDVRFASSLSPSHMFMTSSLSLSSSEVVRVTTRVTVQPSPSLSVGSRTTFMSVTPSITSARFTPRISTPITLNSEMQSTPSTSSPNFSVTSTIIPGMSTFSSRSLVIHSTQLNMTSQSLSMTLFMPSRFTGSVTPTATIKVSPTRSSQVLKSSLSSKISDTLLPSSTISPSIEQTISVFKSSAISFKPSISVVETLLPSYSTASNIQSSLSSRGSILSMLPTTILQMSSSMSDSSATFGSSLVTSEMSFSTREPVSMTISPSLSSDKLSSSFSSLERTIIASRSNLLSSSELRTIPSSMLSVKSVVSSSKTRSVKLSTTIPSTHILPSLTTHVLQTFSSRMSLFSSTQQFSLSDSMTPDQSSIMTGSSSSISTTIVLSSSTIAETSVSRLQSSSVITSEPLVTTKMSLSSLPSTSQTSSTPLPDSSSVPVQSSSTPATTIQLSSLTSRVIPSVTSVITPSFTSYVSPSSVASSFQMSTSLFTAEMVTTKSVTMPSTITRSTSTVRTPTLTITPAITSSPLISRSTTSPTTLNSLLPSLSSTGVVKGTVSSSRTVSSSSQLSPTPMPSSSSQDMLSSSPIIGTTSSMTTGEPTTDVILTTAPRDRKPDLLNPVDFISYRSGTVFEYLIPPDTFFDKEDGSTPHLSLSLLGEDYQLVDPSSWILLDEDKQALFGVVVSDSLVTTVHQFFLVATDSNGGVAYDSFKVEIYPNEIDYSHQYGIILNSNFVQFTANSRNLYNFCRKLVTYHKDSPSSLSVQAVSNGSVSVTYSNNSIPVSFCDLQSIEAVLRRMAYANGSLVPEFQSEMGKLFPVSNVWVEFLGKCAGVVTTDSPVIPKSPQVGDSTVFISLLIGLCLIFILFLIGCLLCMYCTKKRPGEEYLLAEEKIVYTKNRKPVILNNDRDVQKPPRRTYPAVLPDDISPFKSERKATPPTKSVPPPSYRPFPAQDNFLELGDFGQFPHNNPPPGYSPSPISSLPIRQDPPEYQQPPPYFPSQKNSGNGRFQTTHF